MCALSRACAIWHIPTLSKDYRMQDIIKALLDKGVRIPCPEAVNIDNIPPERICAGATLYPGTCLIGPDTFIGQNTVIGQGGGALIENCQIGKDCTLMQGVYRDSTMLDGFNARHGAEVRDNCLLEEGVSLGHTVGLKQTLFMTHVVAGSLINFCDAILCGGRSRKDHSEIGSCMALYNFTPQGDKFASYFGDVRTGVFLDDDAIFIGGQTQIVSPVHVGFGSVIAAGTKLSHNISDHTFVTGCDAPLRQKENCAVIRRASEKAATTLGYLQQLHALKAWYQYVRMPALAGISHYDVLLPAALKRLDAAIAERTTRLERFAKRLDDHASTDEQICADHAHARAMIENALTASAESRYGIDLNALQSITEAVRSTVQTGLSYPEAIHRLSDKQKAVTWFSEKRSF